MIKDAKIEQVGAYASERDILKHWQPHTRQSTRCTRRWVPTKSLWRIESLQNI